MLIVNKSKEINKQKVKFFHLATQSQFSKVIIVDHLEYTIFDLFLIVIIIFGLMHIYSYLYIPFL